ncbi:TWiK family of potassium channels protein 7-like isoform X2 [Apostichopus japonicus]|uniref:TWiK family of potassium channels protein 7-like isoform X2 n=1 Tax=Stichopus japonicus TaxID=307972 RepID=UPI003AB88D69
MDSMKRKAIQYTITFVGQIILIILYTVMGALVFKAFELPQEELTRNQIIADTLSNRSVMVEKLQNLTNEYYYTDRESWRRRVNWHLAKMEVRLGLDVKELQTSEERKWSFSTALFFSATVITTIGYGHIAPVTVAGRIFCMAYAIFGISLLLLVLASIGSLLARGATLTYRMLHGKIGTMTIGKRKKKNRQDAESRAESYQRQNGAAAVQEEHRGKVIDDIWGTVRFDKNGKMIIPEDASSKSPQSSSTSSDEKDPHGPRVKFPDDDDNRKPKRNAVGDARPHHRSQPPTPGPSEEDEVEKSIGFGVTDENVEEEEVNIPLYVVLVLACIYIVLLAGTLLLWEDQWDFFDALYFSFVTLTTIGFGDLVPQHQKNLLGCTFLIILGMAIISMCIALAQEFIMRKIAWLSQTVGVALVRSSSKKDNSQTNESSYT